MLGGGREENQGGDPVKGLVGGGRRTAWWRATVASDSSGGVSAVDGGLGDGIGDGGMLDGRIGGDDLVRRQRIWWQRTSMKPPGGCGCDGEVAAPGDVGTDGTKVMAWHGTGVEGHGHGMTWGGVVSANRGGRLQDLAVTGRSSRQGRRFRRLWTVAMVDPEKTVRRWHNPAGRSLGLGVKATGVRICPEEGEAVMRSRERWIASRGEEITAVVAAEDVPIVGLGGGRPHGRRPGQLASSSFACTRSAGVRGGGGALVVALAPKAGTGGAASGYLVDVESFFISVIVPELQGQDVNATPILKAGALKFFTVFREQIPKPAAIALLPNVIRFLGSESNVVHSYAANCIEKLLMVKDRAPAPAPGLNAVNFVPRYGASDINPITQQLMHNLFTALQFPDSRENPYIMKCVMRVSVDEGIGGDANGSHGSEEGRR